jgi:hypothetical protein
MPVVQQLQAETMDTDALAEDLAEVAQLSDEEVERLLRQGDGKTKL